MSKDTIVHAKIDEGKKVKRLRCLLVLDQPSQMRIASWQLVQLTKRHFRSIRLRQIRKRYLQCKMLGTEILSLSMTKIRRIRRTRQSKRDHKRVRRRQY